MGERAEARPAPTRAEIDLGALRRNLAEVRRRVGERGVIAVVKADAYGHGAVLVARALAGSGCDALAVAMLEEARELRRAGLRTPILVLQGIRTPDEAAPQLALGLTPLVGSLWMLEPLEAAARASRRAFGLHLKVDTGMGRLGIGLDEVEEALARLRRAQWLRLEGLASHLADADDADAPTLTVQRQRFADVVGRVRAGGFAPRWIHLDNSPGLVHGPTDDTTAVRAGLLLYGADPTRERGVALEPVMALVADVLQVKTVPAGWRIGYGGTWVAPRATRILTLPIGYADGLPRAAGGRIQVGVNGRRCPLVGRVSMDLATVDAGPDATVQPGEPVLIFGRRAGLTIRVEELADALDTIPYEILARIGPRVTRVPGGQA